MRFRRSGGPTSTAGWVFWYVMWMGISLLCLGLGVANFFSERVFLAHAELDTGTITRYDLHVRTDGKSEFCPRIEFTDRAGEPVAVQGSDCPSSPDKSKIGKTVQVYYDPNNPDAYEEKTATTGLDGLIFGLIGAVFFGLFWVVPLVAALVRRLFPSVRVAGKYYGSAPAGQNDTMRQDAERYHANQVARERAERHGRPYQPPPQPPAAAPAPARADAVADEEARLAQLKRQADQLQREIDELRRQKGQ